MHLPDSVFLINPSLVNSHLWSVVDGSENSQSQSCNGDSLASPGLPFTSIHLPDSRLTMNFPWGVAVGAAVGGNAGVVVGGTVGMAVGGAVGAAVGGAVGAAVGGNVGMAVGGHVGMGSVEASGVGVLITGITTMNPTSPTSPTNTIATIPIIAIYNNCNLLDDGGLAC